jgi:hypothetical protein
MIDDVDDCILRSANATAVVNVSVADECESSRIALAADAN